MPSSIEKLSRELREPGLTVWAVNIAEPPARVAAWVQARGLTMPVLLDPDGAVSRSYRVTATPTVVLVDRAGQLLGRTVGSRDWDPDGMKLLAAALARRP